MTHIHTQHLVCAVVCTREREKRKGYTPTLALCGKNPLEEIHIVICGTTMEYYIQSGV
jgi:hypothetical protein